MMMTDIQQKEIKVYQIMLKMKLNFLMQLILKVIVRVVLFLREAIYKMKAIWEENYKMMECFLIMKKKH